MFYFVGNAMCTKLGAIYNMCVLEVAHKFAYLQDKK
jgi:hypothetical protein